MNKAVLILGGNIGDRAENLALSVNMIESEAGEIIVKSDIYETEPWGFETDKGFLNMVIVLSTNLTAGELLTALQSIEERLGRKRRESGGYISRTIDIDILFFNDDVIDTDRLKIPHPLMHKRRFTLRPLADVLPGYIHPVLGKPVKEMLMECDDNSEVKLFQGERVSL